MPKDLGIDWKLIEADYLRGTRVVDIATFYKIKKCTLDAKIRRGGWATKRAAIRDALTHKETSKTIQTLSNRATSYLERVVKSCQRHVTGSPSLSLNRWTRVSASFNASTGSRLSRSRTASMSQ